MHLLENIRERAARGISGRPANIALSEGEDPRIVQAAVTASRLGLAKIILLGQRDAVLEALRKVDAAESEAIAIHDPATSELANDYADALHSLRKHKGMTPEKAAAAVADPLTFAAMMVRQGHADGTVGGAVRTTADVVRVALQVIGKTADAKLVSSFFLMVLDKPHHGDVPRTVVFSDCALVVDPDAEALAEIAGAAAQSFQALTEDEPRVAIRSFSTKGSAHHAMASKVSTATELVHDANPDLAVDGELQFDAAFVPAVASTKAPDSSVAGKANVFIFPNLDAGNIGYKIAQRVGGAAAVGPVLQGLAKPANDLSRGCTAEDVLNMIAITVVQAQAGT